MFLNAIGSTVYGLLRDLLAPTSPMSLSLREIMGALKTHFEPKSLIIAERYHFHKRDQCSGESITEYVAELRRLAAKCAFECYIGKHFETASFAE